MLSQRRQSQPPVRATARAKVAPMAPGSVVLGWLLLTLLTVLALAPGQVRADVLITVKGQRIVTEGPWEVKGRRIVYTNSEKTLTAIRTERIDLEASRIATEQSRQPRPRKRYGGGPVEERPDLVALAENTEASRSSEASMILESDTAAGPRADRFGNEMRRLFDGITLEAAARARLQSHTASALRRMTEAIDSHDVTSEEGTRALAPKLHDIAETLAGAARVERNSRVRSYFRWISWEIEALAKAAEKGPEAFAAEL